MRDVVCSVFGVGVLGVGVLGVGVWVCGCVGVGAWMCGCEGCMGCVVGVWVRGMCWGCSV